MTRRTAYTGSAFGERTRQEIRSGWRKVKKRTRHTAYCARMRRADCSSQAGKSWTRQPRPEACGSKTVPGPYTAASANTQKPGPRSETALCLIGERRRQWSASAQRILHRSARRAGSVRRQAVIMKRLRGKEVKQQRAVIPSRAAIWPRAVIPSQAGAPTAARADIKSGSAESRSFGSKTLFSATAQGTNPPRLRER